jgi:hypothetical protein
VIAIIVFKISPKYLYEYYFPDRLKHFRELALGPNAGYRLRGPVPVVRLDSRHIMRLRSLTIPVRANPQGFMAREQAAASRSVLIAELVPSRLEVASDISIAWDVLRWSPKSSRKPSGAFSSRVTLQQKRSK